MLQALLRHTWRVGATMQSMLDGADKETVSRLDKVLHAHPRLQPPWLPRPKDESVFGTPCEAYPSSHPIDAFELRRDDQRSLLASGARRDLLTARRVVGTCADDAHGCRLLLVECVVRYRGVVGLNAPYAENRVNGGLLLAAVRVSPALEQGHRLQVVGYDYDGLAVCCVDLRRRRSDMVTWDVHGCTFASERGHDAVAMEHARRTLCEFDAVKSSAAANVCSFAHVPSAGCARLCITPVGRQAARAEADVEYIYVRVYRSIAHGPWNALL